MQLPVPGIGEQAPRSGQTPHRQAPTHGHLNTPTHTQTDGKASLSEGRLGSVGLPPAALSPQIPLMGLSRPRERLAREPLLSLGAGATRPPIPPGPLSLCGRGSAGMGRQGEGRTAHRTAVSHPAPLSHLKALRWSRRGEGSRIAQGLPSQMTFTPPPHPRQGTPSDPAGIASAPGVERRSRGVGLGFSHLGGGASPPPR